MIVTAAVTIICSLLTVRGDAEAPFPPADAASPAATHHRPPADTDPCGR